MRTIVSFSSGLSAVLIIIGILLVRWGALVERVGGLGSRWSSALSLCSDCHHVGRRHDTQRAGYLPGMRCCELFPKQSVTSRANWKTWLRS